MNHHSHSRRLILISLLMALGAARGTLFQPVQQLHADEPKVCQSECLSLPRPQDQLWLVSDRCLDRCVVDQQAPQLETWRYDPQKSWVHSGLNELFSAENPQAVTTIFVHGNRIPPDEAFTKGWNAYRTMVQHADERPFRFIIWSWPSEAVRGPVHDAREKADRSNASGYYLGWFLDRLPSGNAVSLWGHSLGARVVTGALHLLGGGTLCDHQLGQPSHATRKPMQVVLLVAAIDDDWLMPGSCHGQAMSQVSRMFLVNNGCDALLKRYQLLYPGRGHEQALGFNGLSPECVAGDDWGKVNQIDAAYQVGKRHAFDGYLCSADLVDQMRPYLFFTPVEPTFQTTEATTALHLNSPRPSP